MTRGLRGLAARIYLFGSHATGRAREASDIDIAMEAAEPIPAETMAEIASDLEDGDILVTVDLVDLRLAPAPLAERIRREGILWTDWRFVACSGPGSTGCRASHRLGRYRFR